MSRENVGVVRRIYERWARGDFSATGFFDPEIVYSRIGTETPGMEGEWRGLAEMSAGTREYVRAFSDLRIEAERIIDLGDDRVLVLTRQTAHGKLSGAPFEHELADLITLEGGKIVGIAAYWHRAEALEAVGLSKQDAHDPEPAS
jgi:ketosteroid isomerase-like protein